MKFKNRSKYFFVTTSLFSIFGIILAIAYQNNGDIANALIFGGGALNISTWPLLPLEENFYKNKFYDIESIINLKKLKYWHFITISSAIIMIFFWNSSKNK